MNIKYSAMIIFRDCQQGGVRTVFAYWYNLSSVLTLGTSNRHFTQIWSRKPLAEPVQRVEVQVCRLNWTFCARFGVWEPVNYQRLGHISCPRVVRGDRCQAALLCIRFVKIGQLCFWSSVGQIFVYVDQDKLVWHHFKLLWSAKAIFWFLSSLA